jgi:hypothetical protein
MSVALLLDGDVRQTVRVNLTFRVILLVHMGQVLKAMSLVMEISGTLG